MVRHDDVTANKNVLRAQKFKPLIYLLIEVCDLNKGPPSATGEGNKIDPWCMSRTMNCHAVKLDETMLINMGKNLPAGEKFLS